MVYHRDSFLTLYYFHNISFLSTWIYYNIKQIFLFCDQLTLSGMPAFPIKWEPKNKRERVIEWVNNHGQGQLNQMRLALANKIRCSSVPLIAHSSNIVKSSHLLWSYSMVSPSSLPLQPCPPFSPLSSFISFFFSSPFLLQDLSSLTSPSIWYTFLSYFLIIVLLAFSFLFSPHSSYYLCLLFFILFFPLLWPYSHTSTGSLLLLLSHSLFLSLNFPPHPVMFLQVIIGLLDDHL